MTKNVTILHAITDSFPYGYAVVEKVFDIIGSYDNTIAILEHASSQNLNPLALLEQQSVSATETLMH